MARRRDAQARPRTSTLPAYTSARVSADQLGPPPADWFGPVRGPGEGERGGGAAVMRAPVTATGHSVFSDEGVDSAIQRARGANEDLIDAIQAAGYDLGRIVNDLQRNKSGGHSPTEDLAEKIRATGDDVKRILTGVERRKEALRDIERRKEALRQLVGLGQTQSLAFVVPTVPQVDLYHRTVVASEDMRAFDRIRRGLLESGIGFERSVTVLVGPDDLVVDDPRNLILFCRDERNPMTRRLLEKRPVGFEFVAVADGPGAKRRWAIKPVDADPFVSESYKREDDLEAALIATGDDARGARLADYALVVRTVNPFSQDGTKAFLLAGIRAFGTWGAAEFLCSEAERMLEAVGDDDFVALIRVEARGSRHQELSEDGSRDFYTLIDGIESYDLLRVDRLPSIIS